MSSSWVRCTWRGGPWPGAATPSSAVSAPPVMSPIALNVVRSPTGFSTASPSPGPMAYGSASTCGMLCERPRSGAPGQWSEQFVLLQTRRRLGVVRRQEDGGVLAGVGENPVERLHEYLRLGSDRIRAPGPQLFQAVARVTGEQHVLAVVVDADHRDVPRGVARSCDHDHASVGGER